MNKFSLVSSTCIVALAVAGCSSTTSSSSRFRGALRTLTPEARLAIGTLNLEGTPQAVDAAMAAKLLPLWQLLEQLSSSSTTAPQEVQAVVDQIEATMNADQVSAIHSMNITPADAFSGFQQSGQAGSGSSSSGSSGAPRFSGGGNGTSRDGGGRAFFFSGGPGGFPGGGFGGNNRSGTSQSQNGSSQASQQQASNAVSGFLVNRVIRLLESKTTG